MKGLSVMTNEELYKEYEDLQESHFQESSMDGSGDCGNAISDYYSTQYEAFEVEFNKRGLNTPQSQEQGEHNYYDQQ